MVRDEADIIEATCRHLLAEGVDRLIVADNGSTDATRDILEAIDGVEVVDDPEPAYYQARKMTALARRVSEGWVVPFDADEIWYAPNSTLAEFLDGTDGDVVTCIGWDHVRRHDDKPGHPFETMQHRRREPQRFGKVAFRARPDAVIAQGNHSVTHPGRRVDGLELRHFQYRSFDQFVRKVRHGKAAYDLTDLPQSEGAHWRAAGAKTDEELAGLWRKMCNEGGLLWDPAPSRS